MASRIPEYTVNYAVKQAGLGQPGFEAVVALISFDAEIMREHATTSSVSGHTMLSAATRAGAVRTMQRLLAAGADPNLATLDDDFPLSIAARHSSRRRGANVVEVLLKAGASVYDRDIDQRLALHHAAVVGNVDIVRLLCAYGTPVDVKDISRLTPLHLAARYGHLELFIFLLSRARTSRLPIRTATTRCCTRS